MAIGKTSRMSSVRSSLRAPKFLDKSSGFYGRLDEPASASGERDAEEEKQNSTTDGSGPTAAPRGHGERREAAMETFDFSEGLMEDDGETLLRRKPSRRCSRWRRSSRKKQKEAEPEEEVPQDGKPAPGTESGPDAMSPATPEVTGMEPEELGLESVKKKEEEEEGRGTEERIHFREEEDDQVLIRDMKRGREEEEEEEEVGEEERRMRREQEQGMKVVKRHTVKTYRKALDRAFRRGWEAFVTNLYSVTLTPVTSPHCLRRRQSTSTMSLWQSSDRAGLDCHGQY